MAATNASKKNTQAKGADEKRTKLDSQTIAKNVAKPLVNRRNKKA